MDATNVVAVNTVVDRSVAYSADSAGDAGRIGVHVVRSMRAIGDRTTFAIAVRNETSDDARIVAYVPPDGRYGAQTLVQSLVGPFADFSTTVEVASVDAGGAPALRVDIVAGTIALDLVVPAETPSVADAPAPGGSQLVPLMRSGVPARIEATALPAFAGTRPQSSYEFDHDEIVVESRRGPAVVPAFVAFALVMIAAAAVIARPNVSATIAPGSVRPGARIPVIYRATGLGTASFAVVDDEGTEVEHGALPAGSGSFDVTVPAGATTRAYLFRVALDGPLGRAVNESYVHVDVPAPVATASARPIATPAAPLIRALALDRGSVDGGSPINVYYDVAATSGSIVLVDAATQLTYGKAALAPGGHATFTAPAVPAPRFLTVIVSALRGGKSTQARIGVTVVPAPAPSPSADGEPNAALDPAAASGPQAPLPTPDISAPARVRSGDPIRISVRSAASPVSLGLIGADGTELGRRDLPAGAAVTVFTAPVVSSTQRIRLEASYALGAGRETIVDEIAVSPR